MAPPVHLARGVHPRRSVLCLHLLQGQVAIHAPDDHEPARGHGGGPQEPLRPGQPPDQSAQCHARAEQLQSRPQRRGFRIPRRSSVWRQMGSADRPSVQGTSSRGVRRSGGGGEGLRSQGDRAARRIRLSELPRGGREADHISGRQGEGVPGGRGPWAADAVRAVPETTCDLGLRGDHTRAERAEMDAPLPCGTGG